MDEVPAVRHGRRLRAGRARAAPAGRIRLLRRRRRRRVDARGEPARVRPMEPAAPGLARLRAIPIPRRSILGTPLSFPVLVAPWAYQSMAHPDGERATARAAAAAGTIMVVSSTAVDVLEDVSAASDGSEVVAALRVRGPGRHGRHARPRRSSRIRSDLLDRRPAGLRPAAPRHAERVRACRSAAPLRGCRATPCCRGTTSHGCGSGYPGSRSLVKGVLTAEDAELAVKAGVDGIVVSNHGGRQLDGSPAGLDGASRGRRGCGGPCSGPGGRRDPARHRRDEGDRLGGGRGARGATVRLGSCRRRRSGRGGRARGSSVPSSRTRWPSAAAAPSQRSTPALVRPA